MGNIAWQYRKVKSPNEIFYGCEWDPPKGLKIALQKGISLAEKALRITLDWKGNGVI